MKTKKLQISILEMIITTKHALFFNNNSSDKKNIVAHAKCIFMKEKKNVYQKNVFS